MIINGKNYPISYTNRSLMNIEDETGVGIMSLINDVEKMSQLRTISIIIWAGINNDDVTLDDVIDFINPSEYDVILKEATEAFKKAFDTGEKKKPMTKRAMKRKFGIG